MTEFKKHISDSYSPINRRGFLAAGCALCAGASGCFSRSLQNGLPVGGGKAKAHVIYALHGPQQTGPDWPNVGFDFVPPMNAIEEALKSGCPRYEFTFSIARNEEDAARIMKEDEKADYDGYLVIQMNCWNRVVQAVAASGKATLYADFQYGGSGGFLVYTASFLRTKTPNVGFVASSKMEDLVAAVRCFSLVSRGGTPEEFVAAVTKTRLDRTPESRRSPAMADRLTALAPAECMAVMKESKMLTVGERMGGTRPDAISEELGIELIDVPYAEINAAWERADKDQAKMIAARWANHADRIEGVSQQTLEDSAAMYLAQKEMLNKYGAKAITMNCLGGFYGGHIHAYPCLGFYELQNEGLIGACECDTRSTATMMAMNIMTQGRPGYISDPVIDTSAGQIIYAHCVASNRVFGPSGPANTYQILTHSEDRQGASVRSLPPVGYMTTTVEFAADKKAILFHQAKTVANVDDDRACRTKIAAEPVGDLEKLFREWDQWSWHRVTVYGDLKEPVHALAQELGWRVQEEA